MPEKPLISVLMSVHQPDFLEESLRSIIGQTFDNLEFVVVNDGGGKEVRSILESFQDDRMIIIENRLRCGLTMCLNTCLKYAKGSFLARHDGDDVTLPQRFERQISYFDDEEVGIVSCWGEAIDGKGNPMSVFWTNVMTRMPEYMVQVFLNHANCVLSPGTVFRRAVFEKIGFYDINCVLAQDYNYLLRAIKHFKLKIVPEILVQKREHWGNVWKLKTSENWVELAKTRSESHPYISTQWISI